MVSNAAVCVFSIDLVADELALTCAIIQYQKIMGKVEEAHIGEYGKTICERIESEVGGKYKRLLTQMVEYSL